MPHNCAAYSTAGSTLPSARGGEHNTTSAQPAKRAGTPNIKAVDGSGAEPAGTYNPTRAIGRITRPQRTPGAVSSEERTSELQSLMRTPYAVFCLTHKKSDST